ncbi:MAG: GAF domain-containing sensor histidine kinase [Cyanobacteriota bacterium]
MKNFKQQINDIKMSLEGIEKLSSFEKRSLIAALSDLTNRVKAIPITPEEVETNGEKAAEFQGLQTREQLIKQQAVALQANKQLAQLNTDLEQQVQVRTTELQQMLRFEAMLKRVTDKVRDSLDENYILQTALQELTEVMAIEGCDTVLYDSDEITGTISYEFTTGVPSTLGHVIPIAEYREEYRQLQQGECFQLCKVVPDIRGLFAILVCPIFDNGGVLGNLLLFKSQKEGFDEHEIRLAQQVATQCAIAIRQARLYQAAQAQVTELERLNQLKDDFLSTVSHELRTPITNMKMAIHMLSRTLEQDKSLFAQLKNPEVQRSKITRYFQILINECERETNLIDDLLDLQRLETGRQPFLPTAIQLNDWLPPLLEPFEQRTQNRQQRLETDIAPNLLPLVCDSASLERIITELLNNACKYTPPQETIKLTVLAQGECIQFVVCNSGIEIPPQEQSRIFDKFYRIPKSDRWQQGGTGLGLALVQKLVTRLGGTIQVESGSGQTCFTVLVPRKVHA